VCVRACVRVCMFVGVGVFTIRMVGVFVGNIQALDAVCLLLMYMPPSLHRIQAPPVPLSPLSPLPFPISSLPRPIPQMESLLAQAQGGRVTPQAWAAMNFDEQEMKQMEIARKEAMEYEQVQHSLPADAPYAPHPVPWAQGP